MTKTTAKRLQLKALKELSVRYEYLYNSEVEKNKQLQGQIDKLKELLQSKLINERSALLNQIGQLTEAVSKAIVYTVGKEQI